MKEQEKVKMEPSFLYNDLNVFLGKYFKEKVQKISLNAGFSCPNRDGTVGHGGCTYCNNQTFNPDYCQTDKSITCQLEEGKAFFSRKYPDMKYLAYFQAYTNTYAGLEELKRKYEEALSVPGVVGLVIGTRPDCMPDELLDYLARLNRQTFLALKALTTRRSHASIGDIPTRLPGMPSCGQRLPGYTRAAMSSWDCPERGMTH